VSLQLRNHVDQGRIQPVSLGGAISVIFCSQVSLRVHYCKRHEVYFTTLLWQNNGDPNGPYIANAVFRIVQNHGEKCYFRRFYGGRSPAPPLDWPLM